ncbi:TM2 domain-containing protein [Sphingobium sp. HBC34]|uniref:TM2 domain-containing protein n=1 Tax=Sphingobium cyanobacteriorum TaxID=3063954 RepID=A0ABT8ZJQ4_9SPHN|nr:TM2 domain-containing protein [Sphingobium sp. HBC34]MDO7834764.1 TM2 domain-containing protein [Sphingobium sp. HBC34]
MTDFAVNGIAATSQKYCSGCGGLIHKAAPACPKCGAPQADVRSKERKSRGVAIILALLLGGLGIHKFYLGRAGWGFLYLIFFWTFVPAIIAFVEAIIYAIMSEDAFHSKYG